MNFNNNKIWNKLAYELGRELKDEEENNTRRKKNKKERKFQGEHQEIKRNIKKINWFHKTYALGCFFHFFLLLFVSFYDYCTMLSYVQWLLTLCCCFLLYLKTLNSKNKIKQEIVFFMLIFLRKNT